jgi:hypothetical protein
VKTSAFEAVTLIKPPASPGVSDFRAEGAGAAGATGLVALSQ